MATLSRDEARQILKKTLKHSKADGCQVRLDSRAAGNIRYARNAVSTSGEVDDLTITVESSFGTRSGTATVNEVDDASLEAVVRRSEELARLSPENPEFMELLGPQDYGESRAYYDATASISPEQRAEAALASLTPAREKKVVAAGFLQNSAGCSALQNSKGLFAWYPESTAEFSVTMRARDGSGSGWAARDVNDVRELDTGAASRVALQKALASRNPRALAPGKYTVVLEPAAAFGLLRLMLRAFDARETDEGRSFLSRAGGGTKLGEQIVDERVTIYSDPGHASVPSSPWAEDGRPFRRTVWIDNGKVKNLYSSRYWAEKTDRAAIPAPDNSIMDGSDASLDEVVAGTERGVLVTRFWYIRPVDPQTLLFTGLTRDGTFLIEDGKIVHPVNNFRFNESPIAMLRNLDALGTPERVEGSLVPALRVRDFTFSSLSEAV